MNANVDSKFCAGLAALEAVVLHLQNDSPSSLPDDENEIASDMPMWRADSVAMRES